MNSDQLAIALWQFHDCPLEGGHDMCDTVMLKLTRHHYLPDGTRDLVRKYCSSCMCQSIGIQYKTDKVPTKPIVSKLPAERFVFDFTMMGKCAITGMLYVLVIIDHFSSRCAFKTAMSAMPDELRLSDAQLSNTYIFSPPGCGARSLLSKFKRTWHGSSINFWSTLTFYLT